MSVSKLSAIASRRTQRGVILFIALIVLVAMSLAGIALMRSVDTNVMIAGNLAFRQGATLAADRAFEDPAEGALAWLRNPINAPLLIADQSPRYWATMQQTKNMLLDSYWSTASVELTDNLSGNRIRYVIHRMCQSTGPQLNANCVRVASAAAPASTKGAVGYGQQALQGATSTYYRVTVRIDGPRNTVSYVQAMLN
jgi:type IV pilus assembly protein PilX